jgi:Tol biopolymer transport system component
VTLFTVDRSGRDLRVVATSARESNQITSSGLWSPDSSRLAYDRQADPVVPHVAPAIGGPERAYPASNVSELNVGSWSPDGRTLATAGPHAPPTRAGISLVDVASGGISNLVEWDGPNAGGAIWSPDGRTIAATNLTADGRGILLLVDVATQAVRTLVVDSAPSYFRQLEWAPNGSKIAFQRDYFRASKSDIWVVSASGGPAKDLTRRSRPRRRKGDGYHYDPNARTPTWSPDSRRIAFGRNGDIWSVAASGGRAKRLTSGPSIDDLPHWSPR